MCQASSLLLSLCHETEQDSMVLVVLISDGEVEAQNGYEAFLGHTEGAQ